MFHANFFFEKKNVKTHEQGERMESFFLAETTKYLYLLFDEHNFIHQSNGSVDQQIKATQSPSCNPGSAGYIFNTEAHPIDIGAIHCCSPSRLTYLPEELYRTRVVIGTVLWIPCPRRKQGTKMGRHCSSNRQLNGQEIPDLEIKKRI